MQSARAVARRDHTLADHAQNADLSADRLHRRGRDDVVTGMDRRWAQLGLPPLLDPRCDVPPLRVVDAGVPQRGTSLARKAAAARGGDSPEDAPHVAALPGRAGAP